MSQPMRVGAQVSCMARFDEYVIIVHGHVTVQANIVEGFGVLETDFRTTWLRTGNVTLVFRGTRDSLTSHVGGTILTKIMIDALLLILLDMWLVSIFRGQIT